MKDKFIEVIKGVVVNDKGDTIGKVFCPEFTEKIVDALISAGATVPLCGVGMSKEELLINDGKSNNVEVISNKQIDGLARLICKYYADDPNCCRCPDCWARDEAKDLYEAGYQRQEWISVEERLPERNGRYLTHCNVEGQSLVCILYYCKVSGFNEVTITHWMPLPEPPKMKGE